MSSLKKGENSKTITIKIKKDASKSGDDEPKFSLGETDDKKVKRGKNNSVAIKLPDTLKPAVAKNTPPTGADKTIQVLGNDSYTKASEYSGAYYEFSEKDYGFSDADEGDSLYTVKILSLPERGWLSGVFSNGTSGNPKVGDVLDSIYLDALRYYPVDDESGTVSFQFSVSDSKAFSVPYTMTLNFSCPEGEELKDGKCVAKNTPPTGADKTIQVLGNDSYTKASEYSGAYYEFSEKDYGFSDADEGDSLYTVKILSLPERGWLSGVFSNGTSGNPKVGDVLDSIYLDALRYYPVDDESGTVSFQFSVSDSKAFSVPYTMTLDFSAVEKTNTPTIQANRNIIAKPNPVESGGVVSLDARGTGVFYQYTIEPGAHTERWEGFCVPGIADRATIEDNSSKTPGNNFSKKGPAPFNFIDGKIVFENDTLKTTWTAPINTTNEVMTCKLTVIASNNDGNAFAQSVFVTVLPTKQVADTNLVDDKLTPKPKKEFKLVENSRKFLLYDSRLINGISLTQETSFTDAVNAAINCPANKPILCSDMTCAVSDDACTTTTTTTTTAAAPPEICGNLVDDDGDTLIDFADPDCTTAENAGAGNCGDFFDNDNDGLTDFADAGCTTAENAGAGNCGDFFDNDNDGLTDFLDPDCVETICNDFTDNDSDGAIDFADPDCTTAENTGAGNCADGFDNDNDGLTDGADPDCAPASSALTLVPPLLNDTSFANTIVIVVNGANLSTVIDADADSVANSLFHVQFTGPGSALAVPATGTTVDNTNMLMDGPNIGLGFTRGGITYEINLGLTITFDDDITTDALSGRNCGAGGTAPCP